MEWGRIVSLLAVATSSVACMQGSFGSSDHGGAGQLQTTGQSWRLVVDEQGALRDPAHPAYKPYPNTRFGISFIDIEMRDDGQMCAKNGAETWCGGPGQGVPYLVKYTDATTSRCVTVFDIHGNDIKSKCGLPLNTTAPKTPQCQNMTAPNGTPCELCVDENELVTKNTCIEQTGAIDPSKFIPKPVVCEPETGVELITTALNETFRELGLTYQVDSLVSPGESLIPVIEGLGAQECARVLAGADPGGGRAQWISELRGALQRNELRVGVLITQSMSKACAAVPPGCNSSAISDGIVVGTGKISTKVCYSGWTIPNVKCMGSPLVVDLANDGLALKGVGDGATFALMGNDARPVGWLKGSDDALLTLDVNRNGRIDNGRELFGEMTDGFAPDGFTALARFDGNGDGRLDSADAIFTRLTVWVDNGDGVSETHELKPLVQTGIASIALRPQVLGTYDSFGNQLGLKAAAKLVNGKSISVYDVWFAMGQADR